MNTKFKNKEQDLQTILQPNRIVGMRMDGRSFSKFTKQFKAPYDNEFMNAMDKSAMFTMDNVIPSAMFAYVQSDEISIFFQANAEGYIFGGRAEKILTTSSASATGSFLRTLPDVKGIPVFDARFFYLDNLVELQEYLDWRRLDARKNSITMAASSLFSHSQLKGKSTRERHALLQGTHLETLPDGFLNGRLITKKESMEDLTYVDKRDMQEKSIRVNRKTWVSEPALRERTAELVESFSM